MSFEDCAINAHRAIMTILVCGQDISVAAAVAIASKCLLRDVDYTRVKEILIQQYDTHDSIDQLAAKITRTKGIKEERRFGKHLSPIYFLILISSLLDLELKPLFAF